MPDDCRADQPGEPGEVTYHQLEEAAADFEYAHQYGEACEAYGSAISLLPDDDDDAGAQVRLTVAIARTRLSLHLSDPASYGVTPIQVRRDLVALERDVAGMDYAREMKSRMCLDLGRRLEPIGQRHGLWTVADVLHRWTRRQERLVLWHHATGAWKHRPGLGAGLRDWTGYAWRHGGMLVWELSSGYGVTVKPLVILLAAVVAFQVLVLTPTPRFVSDSAPGLACMEWRWGDVAPPESLSDWSLPVAAGLLAVVGQSGQLVSPANRAAAVAMALSSVAGYYVLAMFVAVLVRKFIMRSS